MLWELLRERGEACLLALTIIEGGVVPNAGVRGVPSLGMGDSFRVDKDEGTRCPATPDPVFIVSPVSDMLPGTGDGADDPFEAPTLRICART